MIQLAEFYKWERFVLPSGDSVSFLCMPDGGAWVRFEGFFTFVKYQDLLGANWEENLSSREYPAARVAGILCKLVALWGA